MTAFSYAIDYRDTYTRARTGTIVTPHGEIQTPVLAPVGTQATVKSLTPEQIEAAGAQLILVNAYHLHLRPGTESIAMAGGIHKYMCCELPIMSDSGGFQVFSLGSSIRDGVGKIANIFPDEETSHIEHNNPKQTSQIFVEVDEEGVQFRSHLDGSLHYLNPEESMQIQSLIGGDFVLMFDECTSPLDSYDYTKRALERTHRWACRSLEAYERYSSTDKQALFGIVQGGAYQDLREISAEFISQLPCFGYSIGGSLGKSKADMLRVLEWTVPLLPDIAPRHLLGIGDVESLFQCVERGIDIFDCVIPTRWARTGAALVSPATYKNIVDRAGVNNTGGTRNWIYRVNLRNAQFVDDYTPIDPSCSCYTCQRFTRAYINHLYRAKELLVYTLVSIHNIHSLTKLMKDIREAIACGRYEQFKLNYLHSITES